MIASQLNCIFGSNASGVANAASATPPQTNICSGSASFHGSIGRPARAAVCGSIRCTRRCKTTWLLISATDGRRLRATLRTRRLITTLWLRRLITALLRRSLVAELRHHFVRRVTERGLRDTWLDRRGCGLLRAAEHAVQCSFGQVLGA